MHYLFREKLTVDEIIGWAYGVYTQQQNYTASSMVCDVTKMADCMQRIHFVAEVAWNSDNNIYTSSKIQLLAGTCGGFRDFNMWVLKCRLSRVLVCDKIQNTPKRLSKNKDNDDNNHGEVHLSQHTFWC